MNWIVVHIKWIMLIAGALTCTMLYPALAPQAALQTTFGATLEGPVADVVVRNWGALIALVGAMLIYGAFHSPVRPLVLVVASASKLVFMGLVLSHGTLFLGRTGVALMVDGVALILFAGYFLGARGTEKPLPGSKG